METNKKITQKNKKDKSILIKEITQCFFAFRFKRKNIQKILLKKKKNLIRTKLDITKLFIISFIVEENQKNLKTNKYVHMSDEGIKYINHLKKT